MLSWWPGGLERSSDALECVFETYYRQSTDVTFPELLFYFLTLFRRAYYTHMVKFIYTEKSQDRNTHISIAETH